MRDGLLGIPAKDVDMEVYGLDAEAVEAALSPHFQLDTVGRAFGVFILKRTVKSRRKKEQVGRLRIIACD